MTEEEKIELDFMIRGIQVLGPDCTNSNYARLVDKVIGILIRL